MLGGGARLPVGNGTTYKTLLMRSLGAESEQLVCEVFMVYAYVIDTLMMVDGATSF